MKADIRMPKKGEWYLHQFSGQRMVGPHLCQRSVHADYCNLGPANHVVVRTQADGIALRDGNGRPRECAASINGDGCSCCNNQGEQA